MLTLRTEDGRSPDPPFDAFSNLTRQTQMLKPSERILLDVVSPLSRQTDRRAKAKRYAVVETETRNTVLCKMLIYGTCYQRNRARP